MVKRKALGAGLEALLSDKQGTNNKKSVTLLGELIFRRNENDKSKKNKKRI